MPLNPADEKRIDAYLASCTQAELEAFREEVALKREADWKNLGDIIRRSDPRSNPEIRAHILSMLPGFNKEQNPAVNTRTRRQLMEAQVLESTSPANLSATIERVLLRMSAQHKAHWRSRGIDPMTVPGFRRQVIDVLLDQEEA